MYLLLHQSRDHVHFAANLMICTSKAIMSYTFDEHIKIQAALHYLANHHLSLRNWREICKGMLNKKIKCYDVEYSLFGVLFYIMDGFLPMMKMFLSQYWDKDIHNSAAIAQILPELKLLGDGVQVSSKSEKCYMLQSECHLKYDTRLYCVLVNFTFTRM